MVYTKKGPDSSGLFVTYVKVQGRWLKVDGSRLKVNFEL